MVYPPHASKYVYLVEEFVVHEDDIFMCVVGVFTSAEKAHDAAEADLEPDERLWLPTWNMPYGSWSLYRITIDSTSAAHAVLYRETRQWELNTPLVEPPDDTELWKVMTERTL